MLRVPPAYELSHQLAIQGEHLHASHIQRTGDDLIHEMSETFLPCGLVTSVVGVCLAFIDLSNAGKLAPVLRHRT